MKLAELVFSDVEEYRASDPNLDGEVLQLDAGEFRLAETSLDLGDIVLHQFQLNRSLSAEYHERGGWTHLMLIPEDNVANPIWCGTEVLPGTLAIMPSGRDQHFHIPARFRDYRICLRDDLIQQAGLIPAELLERAGSAACAQIPLTRGQGRALIEASAGLLATRGATAAQVELARERLLSTIADTVEREENEPSRVPVKRRYALVSRARELIREQGFDRLSVDVLASALGANRRTLNRAFQDVLGVSPYQYLLRRRLNAAREALCDRPCSITHLAADLGFSSSSEFARHYRSQFGELPSSTRSRLQHGC